MDSILEGFLSWQFLSFSLAIGAIVFLIRQIVEYAMSNWWPLKQWAAANKDADMWRKLILPILPVIIGAIAGYFGKDYPYPEGFATISGRFAFSLVAGFTSGLFVRLYNSFLASKTAEFGDKISSFIKPKTDTPSPPENTEDISSLQASVKDSINKDQ